MVPDDGMAFAITEPAPAKINLALHVVGQRADGYHLLNMLVTFTRFGDRVSVAPAGTDRLTISGRFAPQLGDGAGSNNLVLRARDRLREALARKNVVAPPVHLHLEKNLPIASGIGGGSADAAATLRALIRHWAVDMPARELADLALELGADVPMCLAARPLVARGIGEKITLLETLPSFAMVLVNPLVGVATPEIFRRLAERHNPPLALADPDAGGWLAAMRGMRNDLEAPARVLCPEIDAVRSGLERTNPALVRMSGSGATCFGLYDTIAAARDAAAALEKAHPEWFVVATESIDGRQDHGAA
ncbi:MAG TPA: 4-(cytidine 5'-diphospho)-2-C-methyl-D-erythritol kinase [Mycoplana sp.]|nr:4-(cytidine 5'-diphospho)-2-C-methyl-D-erythritol kinase [Mycoplana sp.]